jgi:hypothetical protein
MANEPDDPAHNAGTLTLCPLPATASSEPVDIVTRPRKDVSIGQQRAELVRERVRRKVTRISEYALAGAEIDDEGEAPADWNKTKARVARDARRPVKDRPYYLEASFKLAEAFVKADAGRQTPSLNAEVMNVYVDQRVYPTRDVKE